MEQLSREAAFRSEVDPWVIRGAVTPLGNEALVSEKLLWENRPGHRISMSNKNEFIPSGETAVLGGRWQTSERAWWDSPTFPERSGSGSPVADAPTGPSQSCASWCQRVKWKWKQPQVDKVFLFRPPVLQKCQVLSSSFSPSLSHSAVKGCRCRSLRRRSAGVWLRRWWTLSSYK